MALFQRRYLARRRPASGVADDEGVAGGVDDFDGNAVEVVDRGDALGLGEEPVDESKVAAGGAGDRGDRLGRRGVGGVKSEVRPVGDDAGEFGRVQVAVVVDEADAAVELRVAGEGRTSWTRLFGTNGYPLDRATL